MGLGPGESLLAFCLTDGVKSIQPPASKMGSTPAFKHFSKVQSTFKPPLIANENAFLGDVASNDKIDTEKPISCGIYRLEKGTPLVYTYTYHEMKIILEGEFDISDETGQSVHVSILFEGRPRLQLTPAS